MPPSWDPEVSGLPDREVDCIADGLGETVLVILLDFVKEEDPVDETVIEGDTYDDCDCDIDVVDELVMEAVLEGGAVTELDTDPVICDTEGLFDTVVEWLSDPIEDCETVVLLDTLGDPIEDCETVVLLDAVVDPVEDCETVMLLDAVVDFVEDCEAVMLLDALGDPIEDCEAVMLLDTLGDPIEDCEAVMLLDAVVDSVEDCEAVMLLDTLGDPIEDCEAVMLLDAVVDSVEDCETVMLLDALGDPIEDCETVMLLDAVVDSVEDILSKDAVILLVIEGLAEPYKEDVGETLVLLEADTDTDALWDSETAELELLDCTSEALIAELYVLRPVADIDTDREVDPDPDFDVLAEIVVDSDAETDLEILLEDDAKTDAESVLDPFNEGEREAVVLSDAVFVIPDIVTEAEPEPLTDPESEKIMEGDPGADMEATDAE